MSLDQQFWQERWKSGQTGWDMGHASPALVEYMQQIPDTETKILIPGGGNSYEADWLWQHGFRNIHVIDIAPMAFDRIRKQMPDIPEDQLICGDFFEHQAKYELVLEQTFFCALDPSLRPAYAKKMYEILKPGGKLAGLLFDFPLDAGPPFGGSKEEYLGYFEPLFSVKIMERAHNSIAPRAGSELFFILEKDI